LPAVLLEGSGNPLFSIASGLSGQAGLGTSVKEPKGYNQEAAQIISKYCCCLS